MERYRGRGSDRPHGITLFEPVEGGGDFVFREMDATAGAVAGVAHEAVVGRRVSEVLPRLEHSGLLEVLRRVWITGEPQRRPLLRHRGGHVAAWYDSVFFRLPGGEVAVISEDATERKRQEQCLLSSTETLRAIMDGIPSYVYVADMETHEVLFMNRSARARYGDAVGRICWQTFHHDQSGPCPFCTNGILVDPAGNPTGVVARDYHNPATGEWLESRNQAIHWNNGQLVRMEITTDITERKRMEESLRLAARAFDSSEGILITDAQGIIVKVNDAFTRITGYPPEEAIGRNPRLLKSDANDPDLYRQMWRALTGAGHWSGEIWNRRRDGGVYPQWINITAVRDDGGNVTHYVAHFQDISERKRFEARIEYQALYDALTDLPNRRLLLDRLQQRLDEARRHGNLGGLLFLDLDDFKGINDRLGHTVGDAILHEAGRRLAGCVRKEDTAARFGGDEFVVLLLHLGDDPSAAREHAGQVAEKARAALLEPMLAEGGRIGISTSIGGTVFPDGTADVDAIIRRADRAMYAAKKAGKNRIVLD